MTGMSASDDDQQAGPALSVTPGDSPTARSIRLLEHTQDVVTITVGLILIVLASVLLIAGIVDFINGTFGSVENRASHLLDQVLLVLILVEIVHTVVLSLRAHRLAAQPFIVVGLVAVIRRILFLLSNENHIPTTELALLIGMVVAFVAAYLAVSYFEKPGLDEDSPPSRARGKKNATGRVESLGG